MGLVVRDHSDVNRIFHGLSLVFAIPNKLVPSAIPNIPSTGWKVSGAPVETFEPRVGVLAGGTAMVAATVVAEFAGTIQAGDIARTVFKGITVDGNVEDISVETVVQSGDTLSDTMDDHVANIAIAIAGAGSPGTTFGRIRSTNPNNTLAQIGTGMALIYASSANVAGVLTITAVVGTAPNGSDLIFEVMPQPPTILTVNDGTGFLTDASGAIMIGCTQGLVFTATDDVAEIDCDQLFQPADVYSVGGSSELTLNLLQDLDAVALRLASGRIGESSTDNYKVYLPNFLDSAVTYALAVTTPSQFIPGKRDIALFYQVQGQGVTLSRTKTAAPIAATFPLRAQTGRKDTAYIATRDASFV